MRAAAIEPGRLTVHADRGASMTSKPVALLLSDLGVTKTHSRSRWLVVSSHLKRDRPGQYVVPIVREEMLNDITFR